MNLTQPHLLLSTQVSLTPESIPSGREVRPVPSPVQMQRPAAVLMLTPAEAQALLAEGQDRCEIVLWSNDAVQPLPRALLEHPCVAGVLDDRGGRETIASVVRAGVAAG